MWRPISELRKTDRDYSGMNYPYDYAKKHKDLDDVYSSICSDRDTRSVGVIERIEIRRVDSGEIQYRVTGIDRSEYTPSREFNTQLGCFVSEDNSEFGGSLTIPSGKRIGGNFRYVFDAGKMVYAISTLSHLTVRSASIYQFINDKEYKCLYSGGDIIEKYMLRDKPGETIDEMTCEAYDVNLGKAYFLLTGEVSISNNDNLRSWNEIRVIEASEDGIQEIIRAAGYCPNGIGNLIVNADNVYISYDKMVMVINRSSRIISYYTFLSEEDEKNLETEG